MYFRERMVAVQNSALEQREAEGVCISMAAWLTYFDL